MRHVTSLGWAVLAALTLSLAACFGGDDGFDASDEDATYAQTTSLAARASDDSAEYTEEGGAFGGEGASSASVLGRTIIRNGFVAIEVESVGAAFEAAQALALTYGGYVADSSFSGGFGGDDDEESFTYASLTLRIPADRFDLVVDLRALALSVISISTNTQDVTGEVTDLESDLRNLRAVESTYLELLGEATEVGDVVLVHDRLSQTRGQIERIQGSLALLQSLSDLSTLHVELQSRPSDEPADGDSLLDAVRGGWEASLATLNVVARATLAVIAFSWWIVPIVAVVLAVLYRRGLLTRRAR